MLFIFERPILIIMKREDPLTGEVFYPRRENQKFASRENQIRYNNKKAEKKRKAKAEIDKYLDNNRSILKAILGNKNEVIKSKDFLLGAGFNFGCHTHSLRKDDKLLRCVYDYAFINHTDNSFKIVRNA